MTFAMIPGACRWDEGRYHCARAARDGERCETRTCDTDLTCGWRVVDGRCGPAFCAATDYFDDHDEE